MDIEMEELRRIEPEDLGLHRVRERGIAEPISEFGGDRERAECLELALG
jgi:hypothetical protein